MEIVLLGGDLNAYSVALSFHAAYGVKSTVFCRYRCGITAYSSILKIVVEPNLTNDEMGTAVLLAYSRELKEKPYLIPCGDGFVAFLLRNGHRLSSAYRFFVPPKELYSSLCNKAKFYALLKEEGLPYPKTVFLDREKLTLSAFFEPEAYPAVLKPADSVEYYAHPFVGMKKVYFPKTPRAALEIAERIYASGYSSSLILQERIGSDADRPTAKTLTLLSDREGRVRRGALGEVLVEETAPGAIGNYAAILTRPPDALTCRLVSFLEKIGYCGIANFDILFYRGRSYILELNPRQGRSCDYLRVAGVDLAAFFVNAIEGNPMQTDLSARVGVWGALPFRAILQRVSEENRNLLRALRSRGRFLSPFSYKGEDFSLRRSLYLPLHAMRRMRALKEGKADEA